MADSSPAAAPADSKVADSEVAPADSPVVPVLDSAFAVDFDSSVETIVIDSFVAAVEFD